MSSISEDQIRQFSENVFKDDLPTPDNIYADISAFKDIYIGSLLRHLMLTDGNRRARYNYILDNFLRYANRCDIDWLSRFSDFGLTYGDITNIQAQYADDVLCNSPSTIFAATLFPAHVTENTTNSEILGKTGRVTLTVNLWPLDINKLSSIAKQYFASSIGEYYGVNILLISKDPGTFTYKDIEKYDELYMYNFHRIKNDNDILNACSHLKMIGKRLFIPPLYDEKEIVGADYEELEKVFVARWSPLVKQFKVLPMGLLSASVSVGS